MSSCAVWEFRVSYSTEPHECATKGGAVVLSKFDVISQLRKIAKKWTFQLEEGEKTGYKHYQGRISLFKKCVKSSALKLFTDMPKPNYLKPTVSDNKDGEPFYCMKEQTRLDGPWCDTDPEPEYIPIQYRHITEDMFYPYQKVIFNNAHYTYRTTNYLYHPEGNGGKSTIACLTTLKKNGLYIPPMNDAQRLVEYVFCVLQPYKDGQTPKIFIIDLPRSMSKDCLYGMFSAIEQFKTGFIYDTRYKGKSRWIDSPNIWVFSNELPDQQRLSADRWSIWEIDKKHNLIEYVEKEYEVINEPTNLYKFILNKKRIL